MTAATHAPLDTRLQLAALWTSTLACYVYGDYFLMYVPGKLAAMQAGQMGPLGAVSQTVLLGVTVLMLIPSLMVAGSVLLPPRTNRWANVVAGLAYTALMALIATTTEWHFYRLFAVVECLLTGTIVVLAWRWRGGVR
ncbi:MAG: DUF6326 family protein [Proteobacteria bacterium]|nr:DUF6326 family protein [Pseudomonadota bacterium]